MKDIGDVLQYAWNEEQSLFKRLEQMIAIKFTKKPLSQNLLKRIQLSYEAKGWTVKIDDIVPTCNQTDSFAGYTLSFWIDRKVEEEFINNKYMGIFQNPGA